MITDIDQLDVYIKAGANFIPLHTWNKQIDEVQKGKTPIHSEWTRKEYKKDQYKTWIKKGYNLGYRIEEDDLIVDMDPRNYDLEDSEQLVAELFGYFDFDDLCTELPVVSTGGGGYHIYCKLPHDTDYKLLRETLDEYPGVEFKKKGRQVVCAGSKHPSGRYYTWLNTAKRQIAPAAVIDKITRTNKSSANAEYSLGKGSLTGAQLRDLILGGLDVTAYDSNDKWFPLLCAAHHATNGEGVDEFVEWCLGDPDYASNENTIRSRWESLWDKDNAYTVGTLIRELQQQGEDTNNLKAVLSFSNIPDYEEEEEDEQDGVDDGTEQEQEILKAAKRVAAEIDLSDIYQDPDMEEGVEGRALQMANDLHVSSGSEEIMKCLRLIKAADNFESIKAQEALVAKKILKQASINKMLKELESKIADDLALLLSRKSLEVSFNKGKHLTCPPSGILWVYRKTHWAQISDEFLAKIIQSTLHSIKDKMDIQAQELGLIQQAVKLSRIECSTLTDRINKPDLPPSVVNCRNGEIWIDKDGGHTLRPHNYRSYLLTCLDVEYNPQAECPLFMRTLEEIFANFADGADMIRHMGELLGYTIQPYKNIASWWLLRGPGGDGKSTILKILGKILGDAQLMTTIKMLSSCSNDSNNHVLTSLVGKLSVIIEELPINHMLKDEGVKLLSENTKMEANPKHGNPYPFMYAGNLIMCSNGFPSTRDLTHGMFRRANVIPFNRQFTKSKVEDIDRASDIISNKDEMSGVLNFMLQGLQRLRDRGNFEEPESCKVAKDEWFGIANNVVRFVKENIDITGDMRDIVGGYSSLYGITYAAWCQENDIDEKMRKKKSQFKRDLVSLGLETRYGSNNSVKVYGGKLIVDEFCDEKDDF